MKPHWTDVSNEVYPEKKRFTQFIQKPTKVCTEKYSDAELRLIFCISTFDGSYFFIVMILLHLPNDETRFILNYGQKHSEKSIPLKILQCISHTADMRGKS